MLKYLSLGAAGGTVALFGIAYTAAGAFVTPPPDVPLRVVMDVPANATLVQASAEPEVAPEVAETPAAVAQVETMTAPVEEVEMVSDEAPAEVVEVPKPVVTAASAEPMAMTPLGLGRMALPEEIAAWDLDVRPDGLGLPEGQGDALVGEELFEENCAACHGSFAEGVDNWPKLAGGDDTLADEDPLKTVGSYWPYLSTVWDYVNRSMPFGNAQSLSHDEVYAITAYILYSNDLIDDDFVLSKETFLDVEMPNADGFIIDDRAETEYAIWTGEPCMSDCKDSVEVTMRARVLDVTPVEEGAEPAPVVELVAETETVVEAAPETAVVAAIDPALIAAGEKVFKKCAACHQVGEGAENKTGPHLNGVMGRAAGSNEGFKYSNAFAKLAEDGVVWNEDTMSEFLTNPKTFAKGTRMAFRGLNKPEDLAAISAYLGSFSE